MSPAQRQALTIIQAGITPSLQPGPGRTVELPQPHERIWRAMHGGKPLQPNTLAALEKDGYIAREPGQDTPTRPRRPVWIWRAVSPFA